MSGAVFRSFPRIAAIAESRPMDAHGPEASNAAETMHVLFCANDSYIQHAAVAATSLLEVSGPGPVVIHLMTSARPGKNERMLAKTLRAFSNVRLEIYRIKDERISEVLTDSHLTAEAYLRFLAPEVLDDSISRVIYLDCDLIVLDDLHQLWMVDLHGHAVGAVAECDWMGASTENRLTRLGIPRDHVYVNSGVLLMDLTRWRHEMLADRLFRFVREKGPELPYLDQDALNAVLPTQISLLDRRWNVQAMFFGRWFRKAMRQDYEATRNARRNPGIVHYTTASKPWQKRSTARKRALYYRFRSRTAWRHTPPDFVGTAERIEHRLALIFLKFGLNPYLLLHGWQRMRRRSQ